MSLRRRAQLGLISACVLLISMIAIVFAGTSNAADDRHLSADPVAIEQPTSAQVNILSLGNR